MSEEKLRSFLKTGSDWARMKTTIPGLFILRLPPYKNSPTRLVIELNPVDDTGAPSKKRGLVIRSSKELEEYAKLFQYDRISPLISTIEKVNDFPKKFSKPGDEVLEI
jgi:hypothetical protein